MSALGAEAIEKLQATIERARRSPLYAERLARVRITSLDDLRKIPLTTRDDLQRAGIAGTRAAPLEEVCHYGETSGTTGASNSTWLTAGDLDRNARAIRTRHPDVFGPGRITINRFPFMAAPAHLMQLVAQQGGGVSIPAGNVNWDVPFHRALDLVRRTGANVLAGMPLEPVVLAEIARSQGIDPKRDLALDTFLLGGAPLPRNLQRRIETTYDARVVELYGSTETMLLGTACSERSLHLETDLSFGEILGIHSDEPVDVGDEGRLIVTTIGIDGSPLVRFDTGDVVRRLPACPCGDPRPTVVVLGRESDSIELAGRRFHSYDLIEASAAAADVLDSSVFFAIVLADRVVVRIESERGTGDPTGAFQSHLPDIPVEIERTPRCAILDVEHLGRSPSVYKPVLVSDWTRPGRQLISVSQGMIEWPRLSGAEAWRWLKRIVSSARRRRSLVRAAKVAGRR